MKQSLEPASFASSRVMRDFPWAAPTAGTNAFMSVALWLLAGSSFLDDPFVCGGNLLYS